MNTPQALKCWPEVPEQVKQLVLLRTKPWRHPANQGNGQRDTGVRWHPNNKGVKKRKLTNHVLTDKLPEEK